MNHQDTIPSQLGPVNTMPSTLGPDSAYDAGRARSRRRRGGTNPVWMLALAALVVLLVVKMVF